MRKHLLVAGIAAAALIPTFAFAQQTCEQQRGNRVAGTVAGAGIGALLGSAVAGHGDRTAGAVIGGVGGAVIGNQITKPGADCAHAYGFYDKDGLWHANAVDRASAQGYYDRDGAWVAGAPNGHYDANGRWVAGSSAVSASGYADAEGRWVPASADGYYDSRGQWVAGAASGYYDGRGQWVAGPATGHYDRDGRWIAGEPSGRRDANGVWVADAQPGYYDSNHRWRAGPARGYYDAQGRWIATAPHAGGYGDDASYSTHADWSGAPDSFRGRQAWLEQRIRMGASHGALSRNDANRGLRGLAALRREESGLRHRGGRLGQRDEARMMAKLESLNASLDWMRRDDRRRN